jgi:hypothetical protein
MAQGGEINAFEILAATLERYRISGNPAVDAG